MIALDLARDTEHPLGADRTVYVLYDLVLQAVHLGRSDEALHLARIGHSVILAVLSACGASFSACHPL